MYNESSYLEGINFREIFFSGKIINFRESKIRKKEESFSHTENLF